MEFVDPKIKFGISFQFVGVWGRILSKNDTWTDIQKSGVYCSSLVGHEFKSGVFWQHVVV